MSRINRVFSVLLILILCISLVPVFSLNAAVQAAGWTKDTVSPFGQGPISGEASVIYDGDAHLYKMWYTQVPNSFSSWDTVIGQILTLGINLKADLKNRDLSNVAGTTDAAEIKSILNYLNGLTATQIQTLLQSAKTNTVYATSPDGLTWTPVTITFTDGGAWEAYGVTSPTVIRNSATSYEMWYTGWNTDPIKIQTLITDLNTLTAPQIQALLTDVLVNKSLSSLKTDLKAVPNIGANPFYQVLLTDVLNVISSTTGSIGHATSANGTTWTKDSTSVLIAGTGWDDVAVASPSVIKIGSSYTMWYSGIGINPISLLSLMSATNLSQMESVLANATVLSIGRATSPNGTTWTKDTNPVITKTASPVPTTGQGIGVFGPSVIRNSSGQYEAWYTSANISLSPLLSFITGSGSLSSIVADAANAAICHATSSDGITWTADPDNPIITRGTGTAWDQLGVSFPSVVQIGPRYEMWYTGVTSDLTTLESNILTNPSPDLAAAISASGTKIAIGHAYLGSATLESISITPQNPSLSPGAKQAFIATGTYSDNSTISTYDITAFTRWTSDNPAVATFSSGDTNGTVTAVYYGSTMIRAVMGTINASTTLTTLYVPSTGGGGYYPPTPTTTPVTTPTTVSPTVTPTKSVTPTVTSTTVSPTVTPTTSVSPTGTASPEPTNPSQTTRFSPWVIGFVIIGVAIVALTVLLVIRSRRKLS